MAAKCAISSSDGWTRVDSEACVAETDDSLSGAKLRYTSASGALLELKISPNAHNKRLKSLNITCNAKFMEVYAVKDTLSKYVATVRGTNATTIAELMSAPVNMFAMSLDDNTCEFRELQLRFLSIKPVAAGSDAAAATTVEFCLDNISLVYDKLADSLALAPLVQQGAPGASMGLGLGGSGAGAGGGDLLGLMAMSMMGMAGMGSGRMNNGAAGSAGAGLGMFGPPPGGAAAGRGGSVSTGAPQQRTPPATNVSADSAAAGSSGGDGSTVAADSESGVRSDAAAGVGACERSNSNERSTPSQAPTQRPAPPLPHSARIPVPPTAAAAAPAIDYAQLASILWTVKSTIVDDISQLLDKKLAPVVARLDRMDAQMSTLNSALLNCTVSSAGNSSVAVGGHQEHEQEHTVD